MAALEYRFTRSAPVLRDLAQTRRRSPPSPLLRTSSEHTEKVKPFEFIDSSLGLLGDLQKSQDDHLRREFEQQREFITSKFEREQYDNGRRDSAVDQRFSQIKEQLKSFKDDVDQRFEEVGQRFEEVGQRFDLVETKLDDFRQQVDQRFNEMKARMFNALAYRRDHPVHPVTVFNGRSLEKPSEEYFPCDVKEFWALQSKKNALKRFYLLKFYSVGEYKSWNRDNEASESDSDNPPRESLTLQQAASGYPSKCLEAIALRLGLNYNKIYRHMERLKELRQQVTSKPSKRRHEDIISSKDSEISKRLYGSPPSSTDSESQLEEAGNPPSLPVRNSQGGIDLVSETDVQGTQPPSQGSTEVFSFERTQATS